MMDNYRYSHKEGRDMALVECPKCGQNNGFSQVRFYGEMLTIDKPVEALSRSCQTCGWTFWSDCYDAEDS